MKIPASLIMIACLVAAQLSCDRDNAVQLFNGKNLDNWTIVLADDSADADEVFRVEDGVIKVSGIPNGYIRTLESYENYNLHIEWRWTAEPKNSGALLHIQGEDRVWPKNVECQLMNQRAGDLVLLGPGVGATVKDSSYVCPPEKIAVVVPKFYESNEKPAGEWNSYDILCSGDNIEITVNGTIQNIGSMLSQSSGYIGLQSEGGPMEFRNVYLVPIK